MLHIVVTSVCVISSFHALLGVISVILGVISCIKAEVWLAHSVSPIWSGGFFIITGILGVFCARRKTSYIIMCFTAFSVVSMVTAVVSIQLLRLGLVNHTTDGHTFQKHEKDSQIIVALAVAGIEILVCLLSILLSCRMAKVAKEELCKRREGMFHVKADSDENCNDVTVDACTRDNITDLVDVADQYMDFRDEDEMSAKDESDVRDKYRQDLSDSECSQQAKKPKKISFDTSKMQIFSVLREEEDDEEDEENAPP